MTSATAEVPGEVVEPSRARRPRVPWHQRNTTREAGAGWVFVGPAVLVYLVFFIAPIGMALWASLLDWNGQTNPFTDFEFVGLDNYRTLLTTDGLLRDDFAISMRNTVYMMLVYVPCVTALAFALALVVNSRVLKGRGFYRTAFYFPSITSAVAISVTFLFLFQSTGAVNSMLSWFGIEGPAWFQDSRGVIHIGLDGLGVADPSSPPGWLADHEILGLSWWQWLAGPSVAMCALLALLVWTSSGTYMLFFLAGLQNIPLEVDEAAAIDGAGSWRRFRHITVPLMRNSIVLVVTLALIGSWQVFDSVFIMTQGGPGKSTLTPSFLSYVRSFGDGRFGQGAAIAFTLFAVIVVLTIAQRRITRERM
jgi:multiple sugar transport system permease protein